MFGFSVFLYKLPFWGLFVCEFRVACSLVVFIRCGLGGKGATVAPLLEALAGIWFGSLFVNRGAMQLLSLCSFTPLVSPPLGGYFSLRGVSVNPSK